MEMAPLPGHDRQIVHGYGKGGFKVADHDWNGAIIVLPARTLSWGVSGVADLVLAAFAPIREADDPPIELLLIGTGAKLALLPAQLRSDLRALGLSIEVMDTGAACRTFNLLVSEERRVAAALLPVG